jgi:glycosyltransferase EpsD
MKSTINEGVSLAMIEAMACGLPIIASDARGLKNCITDEQNGLLFPVDDYKALAERILRLANNKELRDKLSLGARSSFETEYDMRKNVKPLDTLFRKYAAMS